MYELSCCALPPCPTDTTCTWGVSAAPVTEDTLNGESIVVDDLTSQIATTVRWVDDPGTPDENPADPTLDMLEMTVRVWFTPDVAPANASDFNRVVLKSLRTPSPS